MSNQYEQLIADYLAGENVDNTLIEACKKDSDLLNKLSQDVKFNRIIAYALQAKDDTVFCDEIAEKIANTVQQPHTAANEANAFKKPKNTIWRPLYTLCASLILAVFIGINYPTEPSIAIVNKVVAAKDKQNTITEGLALKAGNFSLSQGYAEVALNNGVILLLEAPISLTIKTVERISLLEGNLVARVPEQAIGFTIDTPSAEIVDLGTEFGVTVDKSGDSQVHVLTGEVKVRSSEKADFEHLIENQARSFNLQKQVEIIKSRPDLFMRALPGKSTKQPDFLHWSFDKQPGSTLACSGLGINGNCFDANFKSLSASNTAPTFSEGQFNEALYFNGTDTWLETAFQGIGGNKPRTVSFWLKMPTDFNINNAFGILSWGLSDKLSAWQISPNPQQELGPLGSIRIGTNHGVVIGTTPLTDNQWHHIAIVLFGGEQANLATHILLYVDGTLEKTATKSLAKVFTELNHPKSKPLMMGRNIAFNNPNNTKQIQRFFHGWLDEVYIFDSALAQPQIQKLMHKNRLH